MGLQLRNVRRRLPCPCPPSPAPLGVRIVSRVAAGGGERGVHDQHTCVLSVACAHHTAYLARASSCQISSSMVAPRLRAHSNAWRRHRPQLSRSVPRGASATSGSGVANVANEAPRPRWLCGPSQRSRLLAVMQPSGSRPSMPNRARKQDGVGFCWLGREKVEESTPW